MNFKSLIISLLIVFNSLSFSFCKSNADAVDETVIKKLDLKSDSLDLESTSSKLNISDPSLKNISNKLSSKETNDEINLKKVNDEIDSKNDDKKEVCFGYLLRNLSNMFTH